ncbi:MAG: hypothetical protein PUI16_04100 [Clostridia bacterium]|nr:hypothetical protein [Clostridia bacterium]MDY5553826.1 hypothetical protein [Blautia sp.]
MNRLILKGNMFMIICCIFYLAWWILAFRPEHPVKGLRSGWLLIPAALCGIYGVYILAQGFAMVSFFTEWSQQNWF